MVVSGHSVCDEHAYVAMMFGDKPPVMLEQARGELVRWWDAALEKHGEWSRRFQRFDDRSTLSDLNYPWNGASE